MSADISQEAVAQMLEKLRGSHYTRRSPKSGLFVADNTPSDAADMLEALAARVAELEGYRATDAKLVVKATDDASRYKTRAEAAEAREAKLRECIPPLIVIALDSLDVMNAETREECERDITKARTALQETKP